MQQERYRLRVRASDKGEPPSHADVDVELDVVDRNNKPPIWDKSIYGPIHIKENVTVGTVVTSVKARLVYKKKTDLNRIEFCNGSARKIINQMEFTIRITHLSLLTYSIF